MPGDDQVSNQFSMETAPIQQPDITPVAQPSQIRFITPDRGNPGSPMMDLARSLSGLDQGLQGYIDARQQKQDQYDAIKAEADFHKNNAVGYSEAVQQGLIPAYASQAYVNAYKNAQGAVAGQDLQQKFDAAYESWGGKNSDDPNAFTKFAQDFVASNIGTNDPEVLRGLLPRINQMVSNGQSRYIQDKHIATVEGSINAHAAMVDSTVQTLQNDAIKDGQPMDVAKGGAFINAIRAEFLKAGGRADQIDNKIIDAITSRALTAHGSMGFDTLALLDQNVPGTNYTYAQTPYGQSQKLSTINSLESMQKRSMAEAKTKQDTANALALDDVTARTINSIVANPGQPIPDSLLDEGTKYDGKFRVNALGWQDTIAKNAGTSDPQAILRMNWDIMNGGGMGAVTKAMENGVIHNASELAEATKLVQQTKAAGQKMDPIMASEPVKSFLAQAKEIIVRKDALGQLVDGVVDTGHFLGVQYSYQRQIMDWVSTHPNATEADTQEAIAKIGKATLDTMHGNSVQGISITQPQTAPVNPFLQPGENASPAARGAQQQQQQPVQPTQPPQAPAQAAPTRQNVDAWFQGLSPAKQQQINAWAQKAGVTPQQAADRFYLMNPPAPAQAPTQPQPTQPQQPQAAQPTQPQAQPQAQPVTGPQGMSLKPPNWDNMDDTSRKHWLVENGQNPNTQSWLRSQGVTATVPLNYGAAPQAQPPQQQQQAQQQPQVTPQGNLGQQLADQFHAWRETDPNAPAIIHQLQTSFLAAMNNANGSFSGNYTLAAIKDNPRAARILDFISGPESHGNYNAYFGNGGSAKDLSGMTVSQILAWQAQRTSQGSPSSATGRYQIMHDTLKGLKTQLGLTGNEKFTPELQDQLALQLLRNRGYDRWQKGLMSDAEFANNLAQEWASLPNLHTGRSHYEGDGLNHALVSPHAVSAALNVAKSLPGQSKTEVAEK
ncbi:muramidase (phage lysozyme) [Rhodoblastus acidophilus]|uniref:hypothetical protein n=1 Tax=Rhodoblastus acidophilus TaxID=1074 RepID=UPI0022250ADE|nr:hypothetical protein [Rhodoblastus acidophilus]MCW2317140.1 muramidase (phage lysozyme) [Rhodoblastus acidophilus]